MKKLTILLVLFAAFLQIEAQDTIYVFKERGIIRINDLYSNPMFLPSQNITYRLRGSNFVLKDGISNQEYNVGAYSEIFREDTTGFTTQDSCISYLNGIINSPINKDGITDANTTISYEHHEIHGASHYFIQNAVTLGSGDTLEFIATTPNTAKRIHFVFLVESSAQANLLIVEGVTSTAGDTIILYNNDRNSSNTAELIVESSPATVTQTSADTLSFRYLGSGSNPSQRTQGITSRDREVILKANTKYYFQIISGAASNRFEYEAEWYEHTNKIK